MAADHTAFHITEHRNKNTTLHLPGCHLKQQRKACLTEPYNKTILDTTNLMMDLHNVLSIYKRITIHSLSST